VIGLLRGNIVVRSGDGEVIIDVSGVGYRVSVTPATAVALMTSRMAKGTPGGTSGTGAEATLFIHTHVREDAIVLYGFLHADERRCFEALLGAHGVGPSLALNVLAVLSPAALSTAVLEDDIETLCAVPGIGRKTAARLLIDLKSRLDLPDLSAMPEGVSIGGRSAQAEARAALVELGYGPEEIRGALDGLPEARDGLDVEGILRLALRELAGR